MARQSERGEEEVRLESGPLSATLSAGDLFDIRWRGVEVAQRIYVAVRDEAWNTIPAVISDVVVHSDGATATAEFDARHTYGDIDFAWHGSIRLASDGSLAYAMRGQALRPFRYCKIGFNIHHGMRSHAGRTFRCRAEQGVFEGAFEADLQPQLVRNGTLTAMTPHYDGLEIDLDGAHVQYDFLGDRFEMQDHRNWIDANWKSYGTPLEFGFPMAIDAGQELVQEVLLRVDGLGAGIGPSQDVRLSWGAERRLPSIGHLLREGPGDAELNRLSSARPSHIRVDLHPGDDLEVRLSTASAVAQRLGAELETAVHLRTDELEVDAAAMAAALVGATAPIARILVLAETSGFSAFRGACPPEASDALLGALAGRLPGVAVVSGTPQFFVDINRDRPDYSRIDGIVFAANPQVHACDDRSMMQNAQAIPDVVAFARRLYPESEVVLSPVDLLGFGGPFPAGPQPKGDRPANVDDRQGAGFCSAWTLAAVSAMSQSEVTSATLFELVGPRGLIDGADRPFDVLELLDWIGARRAATVRLLASSDPDRAAGIAFSAPDGWDLAVANLTNGDLPVTLPNGERIRLAPYALHFAQLGGAPT